MVVPSGPVTLMYTIRGPASAMLFSAMLKLILKAFTREALTVVASLPVRNCFLTVSTLIPEVVSRAARFFSFLPSNANWVFSPYKVLFSFWRLSLNSLSRAFSSSRMANLLVKSESLSSSSETFSFLLTHPTSAGYFPPWWQNPVGIERAMIQLLRWRLLYAVVLLQALYFVCSPALFLLFLFAIGRINLN